MIVIYPTCSVSTLVPLWEGLWKDADNVYMKSGFNPKHKPGVLSCMVKGFGFCYFVSGIWQFGYIMLQFASPQLLNALIAFVEDPSQPSWKGYLFAALLAVVALISAVCDSQYWLGVERVGLRLRSAISGAVYRKTLRLSNSSRKTQTGKMNGFFDTSIARLFYTNNQCILYICINLYHTYVIHQILHWNDTSWRGSQPIVSGLSKATRCGIIHQFYVGKPLTGWIGNLFSISDNWMVCICG